MPWKKARGCSAAVFVCVRVLVRVRAFVGGRCSEWGMEWWMDTYTYIHMYIYVHLTRTGVGGGTEAGHRLQDHLFERGALHLRGGVRGEEGMGPG